MARNPVNSGVPDGPRVEPPEGLEPAREVERATPTGTPARPAVALAAGLSVVFLVAVNLRTAVVAVPPLLGAIQRDLGLSSAVAGLLTTVPTLCFGVFAVLAPALGRRLGIEPAVAAGLALLVGGQLLRLAPGVVALFGGTLLAGVGAALGNVLLPGLVKRDFPDRVGLLTGTYTLALSGGATIAAGLAVPLEHAFGGWRPSLAFWAAPAAAGLAAASALARRAGAHRVRGEHVSIAALRHEPVAWMLTVGMGSQAFIYYSVVTWMPTVFERHGVTAGEAGWLLALNGLVGLPGALAAPVLAGRMHDQRPLVLAGFVLTGAGLVGLVAAPGVLPALWAVLLGIGTNVSFGLVLTLLGLRAADAEVASGLSAMSQSYGYLVGCSGPFLLGLLHDLFGGWSAPLLLLVAMLVPLLASGLGSARPGVIGHPGAAPAGAPAG